MVSHRDSLVIFSKWTVAYGDSRGTIISFLLSFIATIALLVAKLSEIPAAILPMVVPLAGQMMTAPISAEPDALWAAISSLSSSKAPVLAANSSGVIEHSWANVKRPASVTTKRHFFPRISTSRTP